MEFEEWKKKWEIGTEVDLRFCLFVCVIKQSSKKKMKRFQAQDGTNKRKRESSNERTPGFKKQGKRNAPKQTIKKVRDLRWKGQ